MWGLGFDWDTNKENKNVLKNKLGLNTWFRLQRKRKNYNGKIIFVINFYYQFNKMVSENFPINFKMFSGLFYYYHHFYLLSKASI